MEDFLSDDQDSDMDFLDFVVLEELASEEDLLGRPPSEVMEPGTLPLAFTGSPRLACSLTRSLIWPVQSTHRLQAIGSLICHTRLVSTLAMVARMRPPTRVILLSTPPRLSRRPKYLHTVLQGR